MSNLVHFVKLEMAPASSLSTFRMLNHYSCGGINSVQFTPIDVFELIGMTIDTEYENNQKIYKMVMTFKTCQKDLELGRHLVFRLTGAQMNQYLFGTPHRPFPIIKEKDNYPEDPAGTTMKTFTISWQSTHAFLLIKN